MPDHTGHSGHTGGMPSTTDAAKQTAPAKPDSAPQATPAKGNPHTGHDMGKAAIPATPPQKGSDKK